MRLNLKYNINKWHIVRRDEFVIADLNGYFEPESPAYLYFILSKNRITINHESISFTDNHIKTEFIIQNKNEFIKEHITFNHNYTGLKEVKIVSKFPFNQFQIIDEEGSPLIYGKSTYFLELEEVYEQVKNKDLLDYEVLYIGQSVVSGNNVPVLDRTIKHDTYQKVLEDYIQSHPDKEVFSFFLSFKQDADIDSPEAGDELVQKNFIENFTKNYFTPTNKELKQNVTLLEAALIYYFKPIYNEKFVNHSPNKKHDSFNGISKMNLDKVNVLFGMENFLPKLYTNTVGRKSEHIIEHTIK